MDTLWTVVITQPQSIVVGKHFTATIIKLLNVMSRIPIIHLLPIYFCTSSWNVSAHISKWKLVCKFGVIFHIFIISCLGSRFHAWNWWVFLLYNNLFIYQVFCTLIYRRRSLYSFLLCILLHKTSIHQECSAMMIWRFEVWWFVSLNGKDTWHGVGP